MFGLCFVFQYFVFFQVLQLSHWGRESWLLYFYYIVNVMSLLSFFDFPHSAMGWSVVYDCDISWSYSLTFDCCFHMGLFGCN